MDKIMDACRRKLREAISCKFRLITWLGALGHASPAIGKRMHASIGEVHSCVLLHACCYFGNRTKPEPRRNIMMMLLKRCLLQMAGCQELNLSQPEKNETSQKLHINGSRLFLQSYMISVTTPEKAASTIQCLTTEQSWALLLRLCWMKANFKIGWPSQCTASWQCRGITVSNAIHGCI